MKKNKIIAYILLFLSVPFFTMAYVQSNSCGCFDCGPCFNVDIFVITFSLISGFFLVYALYLLLPYLPTNDSLGSDE